MVLTNKLLSKIFDIFIYVVLENSDLIILPESGRKITEIR